MQGSVEEVQDFAVQLSPKARGPFSVIKPLLIACTACALTLLPMLLYVQHSPTMAPFSMFAMDTFYYLDVARNSQGMPFYTFDGVHPTNGFHPVWQYLLYQGVKHRLIDLRDPMHAMVQLFYGNLAILGAAVFCLALAATRYLKHQWVALLTVCPGWMWFLVAVSAPAYLSSWSFLNGMETAVELFFFACFMLSYRSSAYALRWLPITSFFLGMMVLCRLDDVFFLFPVLGFLIWRTPRASRLIALASSCIPFAMLAVYLAYNQHTVGRAMPVSGAAKASLAFGDNFEMLYNVFALSSWDDALNKAIIGVSLYAEAYVRVLQMLFPMLLSVLYLARPRIGARTLIDWLCVGILLKGSYNFIFVTLFAQGYWYYGSSIFISNLILSLVIDYALVSSLRDVALPRLWNYVAVLGEVLFVLFSMNAFMVDKLNSNSGQQTQQIVMRGAQLAQMVHGAGGNSFVEFDDGIIGFGTNMASLSGFGLVSDPEARFARKHGQLFDLAISRGEGLVVSQGGYANQLEGFSKQAAAGGGGDFLGIRSSEFVKYALQPVLRDEPTDVRLYRLVPRQH